MPKYVVNVDVFVEAKNEEEAKDSVEEQLSYIGRDEKSRVGKLEKLRKLGD
jgi:hypothetical protein